jgi:hypothetical protein
MKAKTFENLIRKIVREEIDYSLRREIKSLKEDLRSELKPTIVEHTKRMVEVPEATKQSLRDQIMGNTPIKQHSTKNFTSNGALNDLLNETAQGNTNTQIAMAPSILETANIPAPVAKAITRNYSELMKAIKNKKGN